MHRRRGKEQLWSIPLFWALLAAADLLSTADAVVEVLSLQDCECQKNCLPFSDYSSHLYSQHANFVLAISWNSFFFDWVVNKKKDSVCFLSCSCVVGTQSHSGCLLFLLWLLLIVDCDFSPDCNCWSWLSGVDCRGTRWWERRKPSRWDRGVTTTTGVWGREGGQSFAKFHPRPMSGGTLIRQ